MDLNDIGLPPTENAATLIGRMRVIRDRLLIDSDWTQLEDAPVDRAAWASYRQQLRDAPQHYDGSSPIWDAPDPPT